MTLLADETTPATRRYADDATTWREAQALLPRELDGPDPVESTWVWEGLDVHLDRIPRADAPLTAIVLHGGGGYGRLLAPYARMLADLGLDVVAPDLPGYGLTACPPQRMRYALWVRCVADLAAAEHVRTGRPILLVGASMGGMLAVHAAGAARSGVDVAGVAATTLLDVHDPEVRRGVGHVPLPALALRAALLDRVRVPVGLVAPVGRMSSLPAVNRLLARDPQGGGGRVPLGFWRSWLTYMPPVAPAAFDRCPVLLAHPLADRWTPVAWSRRVLDAMPAATRFVGLPDGEHLPVEPRAVRALRDALTSFVGDLTEGRPLDAPPVPSGSR